MTAANEKKPKVLPVSIVAERRGVSDRTVHRWIREKGLRAERTSGPRGHWRVKETDLAEWLAARGEVH